MFDKKKLMMILIPCLVIGGAVAYGLQFALDYTGEYRAQGAWASVRPQIDAGAREMLDMALSGMDVPDPEKRSSASCITDKIMIWLPTTSCDPTYYKFATTEEEHGDKTMECLMKAGFEDKTTRFLMECIKGKISNDWKIYRSSLGQRMSSISSELEKDPKKRKALETCVLNAVLEELNASPCKPIDMETEDPENLLDPTECLEKEKLDEKIEEHFESCKSRL